MVTIFLGLTISNLFLLILTAAVGLFATDGAGHPGDAYLYHLGLGVMTGLMAAVTHVAVYTYFMATTRWLGAAADKVGLSLGEFVEPALRRKSRAFLIVMGTIVATMVTMFAGAGADPTRGALWPAEVHLVLSLGLIVVHIMAAFAEYALIRSQGALMDRALAQVNGEPAQNVLHKSVSPS